MDDDTPKDRDGKPLTWASHPVDVLKHFWPDMPPEAEAEFRKLCDAPVSVLPDIDA
jgi:hypothetical protein